ncbi:hypothetical protein AG1IA_07615 [Rhizoctonia solani AG-1 IA]|uniref:Uncharacterized protein n=1 Tax=Thanatephorus cucumeris (strain AG1-IA) TaxID=983506 RepID=L8WNJ7_THACA|nr:hypothetical protein AG1IA_07615 [Rhizoctonia solani AG-1 IA]
MRSMSQIEEQVDMEKEIRRKIRKTKDAWSFDMKIVALVTIFAPSKNKQRSVNVPKDYPIRIDT